MTNPSRTRPLPPQVIPPRFELDEAPLRALDGAGVVALPVLPATTDDEGVTLGPGTAELLDGLDVDLLGVLEHRQAKGKAGEVVSVPLPGNGSVSEVVLVGVGDASPRALRAAGAGLARAVKDREAVATTVPSVSDDAGLRAFVVGATLGSFEFHWRSEGPKAQPVRRVVLPATPSGQDVVDRAVAIAGAGWLARSLATVPSNLKNPGWLAEQALEAGAAAGLDVTVWDEERLESEGFGGILAVGRASATPPRMIQMEYRPGRRRGLPHVVIVGKGITFDTGGLSIKPGESMVNMKRDMTGGAVVIATMRALAAVGCPVRVTGLVAAAENAISGASYRPGDVITHYGGRTTEVTNTDAEGRLVMADAMAYAVDKLKPDALVDVATLTGAMKVALGLRTGGYFANHEVLGQRIADAAAEAGEPLWRMPLAEDYEEKLTSKVADADNGAGNPGAITAALFLQHFAGDVPWVHLDVASVGDSPEENAEWTAGPTGFGAKALLHWLEQPEPTKGL